MAGRSLMKISGYIIMLFLVIPFAFATDNCLQSPEKYCVEVISPSGGESYSIQEDVKITWQQKGIDKVIIGYKWCDSCLSWIEFSLIVDPNQQYQSYTWNIPQNLASVKTLWIEITGYKTGVGSDTDISGVFNILDRQTSSITKQTCTDSDDGFNSEVKGELIFNNKAYTDFCESGDILTEYFCDDIDMVHASSVYCSRSGMLCKDGACIISPGISYPDEGNISFEYLHLFPKDYIILDGESEYIYADVGIINQFSSSLYNVQVEMRIPELDLVHSQIINEILPNYGQSPANQFRIDLPPNTPSGRYKIEFKVIYNINNKEDILLRVEEREITQLADIKCSDSDGFDPYNQGSVVLTFNSGYTRELEDACCTNCHVAPAESGPWVSEYYCNENNLAIRDVYRCPLNCKAGKCTEEGRQPLGEEPQPLEISEVETSQAEPEHICTGCLEDNVCYPLGYRKENRFCDDDYTFKPQLQSDLTCENNFECTSNVCLNGECVSGNLLQRILNWFKSLFGIS